MFNAKNLKQAAQLVSVFAKKDRYYRKQIRSWEDFKQLPITGRSEMKRFAESGLISNAFNLAATSGSSSSRMMIAHSEPAYAAHLARLVKLYRLVGVKKGMLCLNLCSYELNSGGRLMEAGFKAAGCGVIPLGSTSTPERLKEAIGLIKALKPTMINAYTNQLFDIFALLRKNHSIKRCLVNGEPLWPQYRQRIEKMGGVHIHDHYGAMEISGLAVALKPADQYMRVVADDLLLEVLSASGETSQSGSGDLLVTDLNNTSMPFIRYRLGDRVELIRHRGALGIKVLSRTEDSLLINGVVVLKQELIRAVNDSLGHPRFFFVLDKHPLKYYDKLIVNLVDKKPRAAAALIQAIVKATGIDRCIDVRTHQGSIPRTTNGKIRYFIDSRKDA